MMNAMSNAAPVFAGIISVSMAMFTGAEVVLNYSALPMVEGKGYAAGAVVAGSETLIQWDIIKRTDCAGENSRVWHGASGFYLVEPLGQTNLPKTADWRTYDVQTQIPELAPNGPLALTIEGHYQCPSAEPVPFKLGPVVMEVIDGPENTQ